jgi:hypothetical protein
MHRIESKKYWTEALKNKNRYLIIKLLGKLWNRGLFELLNKNSKHAHL